jgi:hypothetical protein
MITRDYHGCTLLDALNEAASLISDVRTLGESVDVEFITGNGVIRTELYKLLKHYRLDPYYKLGNSGSIICTLE